ncbi:hypothetical protein TraAM80_08179 [Trypanosoma rangeli]|uniref:Uncharacterized protein n=1 Tax=Trypanosoma rangeli TaxID=5698 RepID=A0A3R7M4V0_TRYRA|nr:uncharacterized protein TraAM80_08179 [Trypanosoma rangeli]RNE99459.1 hypothetical protein TraAM80_08179 [Trypanosoma rangeli]|eukprot:RNE99459.1 hypothetical protein TraAM80_08179 [Trypanosoma rangeli]
MWSVIRRLQGESPPGESTCGELRYERNQRCIMMHEMKRYPRTLDPDVFTRPFGEMEYEKVRAWMLHDSVDKRRQAMNHLLELHVLQRENVICSLRYGFLDVILCTLHHDESEEMRCKAAEALAFLLRETKGLDMFLAMDDEKATLCELLKALDDPSSEVIILVLRVTIACRAAYNAYEATLRLVKYGFIERCIALLRHEEDRVTATACSALVTIFVVKEAFIQFIQADGMAEVTEALRRNDPFVVAEAAEVVIQSALYRLGKKAAVNHNTLVALQPYMLHDNLRVRTAVTGAVAQLTIYEPGKQQAVDENVAELLLKLLMKEEERDVLVNVLKTIVNVAEHPVGRRQLLVAKDRLQFIAREADDYQPLTSSVAEALSQLERKC